MYQASRLIARIAAKKDEILKVRQRAAELTDAIEDAAAELTDA